MTRKMSAFPDASAMTGADLIGQQGGVNKLFPLSVLEAWVEDLVGSGGGGPLTAVVSADSGTTDTALTTVMSFTVEANKVYRLVGSLFYRTTATSKGIDVAIGGTAGTQSIALRASASDSSNVLVSKTTKTKDSALSFPTSAIGGDDNFMDLAGLIFTTSAGTVLIKFATPVEFDYCAVQKGSGAFLQELGTITP